MRDARTSVGTLKLVNVSPSARPFRVSRAHKGLATAATRTIFGEAKDAKNALASS